jgi:AcrR family transcriptional regulator
MDTSLKREHLKEKIILTTFNFVKDHSLEALSIREISKNLGINIASINYYFAGKENLLTEVFKHFYIKRTQAIETLAQNELNGDSFSHERFFENVCDLFTSAPEEAAFAMKSMLNSKMEDKNGNFQTIFESDFPTPPGTNAFREILLRELGEGTPEEHIHFITHTLQSQLYMHCSLLYSNVAGKNPDHSKDHEFLGFQALKNNFLKLVSILVKS